MSINQAIGNARSGLAAQSRAAEIVSRNVANASTEGYAAKRAQLSHQALGGVGAGVKVEGVARAETPLLTASRRRAEGEAELAGGAAETARALSDLLGPQGPAGALSERFAALETSLRNLADTPESLTARRAALDAASGLVKGFNAVSAGARRVRIEHDAEIGRQVEQVNGALEKIARLNREIQGAQAAGRDPTSLQDERDRQIDLVNGVVPVRATRSESGSVEVRTQDGTLLAGHAAKQLAFTPTSFFDEGWSWPGNLSGVHVAGADGAPTGPDLAPSPGGSPALRGGSLEAAFLARDRDIPAFAAELNALAAEVTDRFAGILGADATGGLFVDGGTGGDGLAARLALHPNADATRLQQGLDLADARPEGDGAAPLSFYEAFMGRNPPGAPARDLSALAADLIASRETQAETAESEAAWLRGAQEGLRESELAETAVDTDSELQNLLVIERAYAANARVLQTADEMIRRLLEL